MYDKPFISVTIFLATFMAQPTSPQLRKKKKKREVLEEKDVIQKRTSFIT